MRRSKHKFRNANSHPSRTLLDIVRWKLGLKWHPHLAPAKKNAIHVEEATLPLPDALTTEPIRLTWIGHSTFLIQIQGRNILTDPIFGNCQPLPYGRFRRVIPPGLRLDQLPPIHDVLISHSHYDHLDYRSIRALGPNVRYWVPKGLMSWFRKRGFRRCFELGWWNTAPMTEAINIHCVPAQHGSSRSLFDRNRTHWCGWIIKSKERSIYFAGDTGYCPIFSAIGARFGPIDLSLIPIGAYEPRWLMQTVHLNPAEAVQVHLDVHSKLSVACHWGTFRLTDESLDDPPNALAYALAAREIDPASFVILKPGIAIDV